MGRLCGQPNVLVYLTSHNARAISHGPCGTQAYDNSIGSHNPGSGSSFRHVTKRNLSRAPKSIYYRQESRAAHVDLVRRSASLSGKPSNLSGGSMIYDTTNAKPQRPGWGFVQSTLRMLAQFSYRIGTAGAIAVDALFHIAFHRAGGSPTLLRGALL